MKKLVLIVFMLFLAKSDLYATKTVRLTNGEWAPYLSENLADHGIASKIVTEAFSAVGVTVKYGFFPWKRSYLYAEEGSWDGTVVWVRTAEREKHFIFSDVVITDNEYLFHLKENPITWNTLEDLQGLVIGGTLHTAYPKFEVVEKKGVITIERSGTYANLFQRLLKRRIDAIPQVKLVGLYLIQTTVPADDQNKITYSPTVIETRDYHLILSKAVPENRKRVVQFNKGLQLIKDSGLYDAILAEIE